MMCSCKKRSLVAALARDDKYAAKVQYDKAIEPIMQERSEASQKTAKNLKTLMFALLSFYISP